MKPEDRYASIISDVRRVCYSEEHRVSEAHLDRLAQAISQEVGEAKEEATIYETYINCKTCDEHKGIMGKVGPMSEHEGAEEVAREAIMKWMFKAYPNVQDYEEPDYLCGFIAEAITNYSKRRAGRLLEALKPFHDFAVKYQSTVPIDSDHYKAKIAYANDRKEYGDDL